MLVIRLLAVCLIGAVSATAQPPARPGRGGAVLGGIYLNSAHPDAAIAFWTDLIGASTSSRGSLQGISMIGATILFMPNEPTGPSAGSAIDNIGLHVPDLQPVLDRLAKTAYKSFQPPGGEGRLIIDGPDGVRIELTEDNTMYAPLQFDGIQFNSPKPKEMQAWYGRVFSTRPGPDDKTISSRMAGTALIFAQADSVSPTAGRAIDHIALEIRDLENFCKKLAGDGIKFDSPYHSIPETGKASAFLTDPWGTRIELTESLDH